MPFDLIVLLIGLAFVVWTFARRMEWWPGMAAHPLVCRVVLLPSLLLFATGVGTVLAMILTRTSIGLPWQLPIAWIVASVVATLALRTWRLRRPGDAGESS